MLPSIISSELEQAAKDSIRTSFNPTTHGFRNLIDRFLSKRENLFKGPYISLSLPFKQGVGKNWFPEILCLSLHIVIKRNLFLGYPLVRQRIL